jgi:hypothetical protein
VQYKSLNVVRLLETQRRIGERIKTRFPTAGLGEVAAELTRMVEEASVRAEAIRRPNWPLRGAVGLLALGALAAGVRLATSVEIHTDLKDAMGRFQFVQAVLQSGFFLGAVILFLVSLEIRLKRRRALGALHELRAMAHIIDMHQVAKDPEALMRGKEPDPKETKQTTKTPEDLNRYLNYCNEMLAILSKVAALYVQDFPDAPTVAAADQVENLCTGLSEKIWQKIVVLDQLVGMKEAGASAAQPAASS